MRSGLAGTALAVVAGALLIAAGHAAPLNASSEAWTLNPPVWPERYRVAFTFVVPYLAGYQGTPLRYTMKFSRDSAQGFQRVERDNSEIWIEHAQEDMRWYSTPANHSRPGCLCERMSAGGGPTRRRHLLRENDGDSDMHGTKEARQGQDGKVGECGDARGCVKPPRKEDFYELMSPALPRIEMPDWELAGMDKLNGLPVAVWRKRQAHNLGYGDVTVDWKLSVAEGMVPKRLDMWGTNWFTGGHWDHYVAEFTEFEADPEFRADEFDVPKVCRKQECRPSEQTAVTGGHHLTSHLHRATSGLLPPRTFSPRDPEYELHSHMHGRVHAHADEYRSRRAHYYKSKQVVERHNAEAAEQRGFTAALNHLADWSREEFRALLRATRHEASDAEPKALEHHPHWPLHMLPPTVDWRGSGADSIVKDQAMCGSCWAFAAVAPMEAAYFREYGELQLLSEQFLMDCSWPEGNTGCNGGFQDKAFAFAVHSRGLPAAEDYVYRGVNMPCVEHTPRIAAFHDFVRVKAGSKAHLKEALLTRGPMTVSINADDEAFRFYKSGIYYNPNCTSGPPDALDHAVMISGYGRDPDTGRTYWILKNIWSTYWGEGGYMRMDMDRNDCGVTAAPAYVRLDKKRTNKLRAARAAEGSA